MSGEMSAHKVDTATPLFAVGTGIIAIAVVIGLSNQAPAEERHWDERVIQNHVRFSDFQGHLNSEQLKALRDAGEVLFTGKFTKKDGFGRPKATQAIIPTKRRQPVRTTFQRLAGPDANACTSCHNDPVIGGAGHGTANVFVSEGFTNADFDSTDPQFSNERNTNHLMGAGLVELLARELTADLIHLRQAGLRQARTSNKPVIVELTTKGISFGRLTTNPDGTVDLTEIEGIDSDLHVRPFSHKGVFGSIRQFTINAMNHHHGMQARERFGVRWTGETDFDEDKVEGELSQGDISALVAWQAALAPPTELEPDNEQWAQMKSRGKEQFVQIGCAQCHRPALPLRSTLFSDPGPFDAAGTLRATEVSNKIEYDLADLPWIKALPRDDNGHLMVPLFSDLKRHKISDNQVQVFGNELLSQRFVGRDQFQTTELWGVASTAPYGHRGNLTTLDEAIRGHAGDAATARNNYRNLPQSEQQAIIAFLKSLVIRHD
jgi:hypothetical protein